MGGCRHRHPQQNLPGLPRGGSPASPFFPPVQELPAAQSLEPLLAPCYSENQVVGSELVLRGSGSIFAKVRLRGGHTERVISGEDCVGCFVLIIVVKKK